MLFDPTRLIGPDPDLKFRQEINEFAEVLSSAQADIIRAQFKSSQEIEHKLRQEWWLNHNNPSILNLYGDDGEMQCSCCKTDFKRAPLDDLEAHVHSCRMRQYKPPFQRGQRVRVNHPRFQGEGIVHYDTGPRERVIYITLENGHSWPYEVSTVSLVPDAPEGEPNVAPDPAV